MLFGVGEFLKISDPGFRIVSWGLIRSPEVFAKGGRWAGSEEKGYLVSRRPCNMDLATLGIRPLF